MNSARGVNKKRIKKFDIVFTAKERREKAKEKLRRRVL